MCKDCGRQFVENPPNKRIPQQLWDMVDKLLLEKIPIECGLLSGSSTTSNGYGNHCHQSTVNAPFVTLIFGLHMSRFFPKTDIEQLVKKAERRMLRSLPNLRSLHVKHYPQNKVKRGTETSSIGSYGRYFMGSTGVPFLRTSKWRR